MWNIPVRLGQSDRSRGFPATTPSPVKTKYVCKYITIQNINDVVWFEALMMVTMKTVVSWYMALCSWVEVNQSLTGPCWFQNFPRAHQFTWHILLVAACQQTKRKKLNGVTGLPKLALQVNGNQLLHLQPYTTPMIYKLYDTIVKQGWNLWTGALRVWIPHLLCLMTKLCTISMNMWTHRIAGTGL
jgi:hypothetical protein